jgi:hypothetical protein
MDKKQIIELYELVALMTFGVPRYNGKYEWELLRYCTKLNTTVVGGASKLFKSFLRTHEGRVISYADRHWSQGNLYQQLGFSLVNTSPPSYFYVVHGKRERRERYQKHKLATLLSSFNPELTEKENMKLAGYHAIYDCGSLVFEFNRT